MLKRFSHSAIASYRNCPRQFKFQYLERPQVTKRVTADAYMGNAVHRVLYQLYEAAGFDKVLPLEQVLEIYNAEWEKAEIRQITVVKENLTVDDYINAGRKMLTRYYERHKPFDQGTTIGLEKSFAFRLPNTPFSFTATVDRLWRREDGVVEICDYKTGEHLPRGGRDPKFFYQMGIYQLAVQEAHKQFTDIEVAQYFLKLDEVVRYRMSEEDLEVLVAELKATIHETIHAERLDDFPTQESGLCSYCAYFDLCPAKRHRLMLEKEAGAETGEKATAESIRELAEHYLEVDRLAKEYKGKLDALKADLIQAAKELGVDKVAGTSGEISVKSAVQESFVTKTQDPRAWADLSFLLRELNLDDYLQPDASALMREVYKKGILPEEQMTRLKEFVIARERSTVRPKYFQPDDDEGDA